MFAREPEGKRSVETLWNKWGIILEWIFNRMLTWVPVGLTEDVTFTCEHSNESSGPLKDCVILVC